MVLAHPHRAAQRPRALLEPSMAKLFASDDAVSVTQEGQLLHGGWGYAEEFPISRYVDAQVLPIFEGVKPILGLKGRGARIPGGGGATLTPAGAVRGRVGAGVRIGC